MPQHVNTLWVFVWGIRQPVLSSLHFIKLWNCNRSKEVREENVPAGSAQQQHQCYWPRKKRLPWGDFFQLLPAVLVHVANAESHEAAADQRHCGCRNHGDSAASNTDQEPQAHAQNDLGQLHHAGQSSAVDALPSPVLPGLLPFLQLQALKRSTEQSPETGAVLATRSSCPQGQWDTTIACCSHFRTTEATEVTTEILQVTVSFPSFQQIVEFFSSAVYPSIPSLKEVIVNWMEKFYFFSSSGQFELCQTAV